MYMHIDNTSYSERRAGVATSSSVCGSYTYRGSSKPLGHDSLDDNLFLDGSTGYFISEDRTSAKLQIYRLSSDFLSVSALVTTLPQYEAPAMAKIGGTLLPVRLAPDRLVHQRQPVRHGHLDHRHLERPGAASPRPAPTPATRRPRRSSRSPAPAPPATSSSATGGTPATSPTPAMSGSR